MSKCQLCKSERLLVVGAKCSDMFNASFQGEEYDGYVPGNLNIGEGDYVEFTYCLDCGRIRGKFPVDLAESERWERMRERSKR